jgi:beta-mannosidase
LRRMRLRFAAVDYLADVWLNGEHLGHHEGCFAPFGFDVTDRLQRNNKVVVAVQDPLEDLDPEQLFFFHRKRVIKGTLNYHDSRPGGLPGRMLSPLAEGEDPWVWTPEWGQSMTTGGIVEPVTLECSGDVSIDAGFVTPIDDAGAAQIAVVMTNHATEPRDVILDFDIGGLRGRITSVVSPGASRVDATTDLGALPPWEPVHSEHGKPVVHDVTVVVSCAGRPLDRRTIRFGRRTARVVSDDRGHAQHLALNDRSVFIKAVNYIPWQHFAEVGRSFYDRDMRMIADAHGNSVGIHAHVQSPHCYDAADDAGMLVFQDFPLQWFYDSGTESNPGFVDTACRQITEMAYLLHEHPSVVYYACHNEPARMFSHMTGVPADDGPETDLSEANLDAALERALRSVETSRHVHQASGIGDDVHAYDGSLSGGTMYNVGNQPGWFVSEYGFWTVGPDAHKFGDVGWPPDGAQMREWVSRLSFMGSTCAFAGLPRRYESLDAWTEATQAYGAALARWQTEWFRAHRGAPYMGYRWHFWSDWWGYAGAGLVDVERTTKATYDAYRDASRPLLMIALTQRSVIAAGSVTLPLVAVNDRAAAASGQLDWAVHDAMSALIGPDAEGAQLGLAMPADGEPVAVPHTRGEVVDHGALSFTAPAAAATNVGEVTLVVAPGESRTVVLRWTDPVDGAQENTAHLHCPAPGEVHAPGFAVG